MTVFHCAIRVRLPGEGWRDTLRLWGALRGSADEMSFLKAKGWGVLGVCLWEPLVEFLLHTFLFMVVC